MININKIAKEITNDIFNIIQLIKSSNIGINEKVNKNTLSKSKVLENVKYQLQSSLDINIIYQPYVEYIEHGRRKGAKFPPIEPIIKWCKQKGIPTENSTIFLIRRAISRDGIKPRPIVQQMLNNIDEEFNNKYYELIFNEIITILNTYFK